MSQHDSVSDDSAGRQLTLGDVANYHVPYEQLSEGDRVTVFHSVAGQTRKATKTGTINEHNDMENENLILDTDEGEYHLLLGVEARTSQIDGREALHDATRAVVY